MRIVAETARPECKITIFSWNQKYLVKVEQGPFEQTYKVSELVLDGDAAARRLIADETFIREAIERFAAMHESLQKACARL